MTIGKQLRLVGAGNGNTVSDSIVQSAAANTPVMTVTTGGIDATHRQSIENCVSRQPQGAAIAAQAFG